MNKSHLVIIVLFALIHSASLGMLTVNKLQSRSAKKYFTQEKIEKDEWRASEESQKFLGSFGQHSMKKTGDMFCDLSVRAKQRVLPCLSHNQKRLVWCGANDLTIPFLSAVFNGCEKVATMYSQKPIGEILEAYASAKEMKKWCPIFMKDGVKGILKEEHYMVLKGSKRIFLAGIDEKATIHSVDVPQFMNILKMLHDIDPETIGMDEIKGITDSIKLDLSLSERGRIFYGMIPNGSSKSAFLASLGTMGIFGSLGGMFSGMILKGEQFSQIDWKFIGFLEMCLLPFMHTWYLGTNTYPQYQDHLKTNVLPNQPTLTDYLKKTAS